MLGFYKKPEIRRFWSTKASVSRIFSAHKCALKSVYGGGILGDGIPSDFREIAWGKGIVESQNDSPIWVSDPVKPDRAQRPSTLGGWGAEFGVFGQVKTQNYAPQ